MTVFCPNCGKPNTDTATQCVACGTALKPKAAASKFKGTM
ncbi:MAG: zinc-ribbon domain-containing protein, partial [Deltaproteobacteria bacterium]